MEKAGIKRPLNLDLLRKIANTTEADDKQLRLAKDGLVRGIDAYQHDPSFRNLLVLSDHIGFFQEASWLRITNRETRIRLNAITMAVFHRIVETPQWKKYLKRQDSLLRGVREVRITPNAADYLSDLRQQDFSPELYNLERRETSGVLRAEKRNGALTLSFNRGSSVGVNVGSGETVPLHLSLLLAPKKRSLQPLITFHTHPYGAGRSRPDMDLSKTLGNKLDLLVTIDKSSSPKSKFLLYRGEDEAIPVKVGQRRQRRRR